jgi:hypothetical protein
VNDIDRPARQIGVLSADQIRDVDGIDLFRGIIGGRFPAPPITETPASRSAATTTRSAACMAASPRPCSIQR